MKIKKFFKLENVNDKAKIALTLLIPLALIIWAVGTILNLPPANNFASLQTKYFVLLGIAIALLILMLVYAILKTRKLNKQELKIFEEKTKMDLKKVYNSNKTEFSVHESIIVKAKFENDALVLKYLKVENNCPITIGNRLSTLKNNSTISQSEIDDKVYNNLDYYFETTTRSISYSDVKAIASSNWYKGSAIPEISIVFKIPLPKEVVENDARSFSQKQLEKELFEDDVEAFMLECSNDLLFQLAKHNITVENKQALNAKPLKRKPKFKNVLETKPINAISAYALIALIFLSGLALSIFVPKLIVVCFITTPISIYLLILLITNQNVKIGEKYLSSAYITSTISDVQSIKIFTPKNKLEQNLAYIYITTPIYTFTILSNKKNTAIIEKYFNKDIIKYY